MTYTRRARNLCMLAVTIRVNARARRCEPCQTTLHHKVMTRNQTDAGSLRSDHNFPKKIFCPRILIGTKLRQRLSTSQTSVRPMFPTAPNATFQSEMESASEASRPRRKTFGVSASLVFDI